MAVSLAVAKAAAMHHQLPFYRYIADLANQKKLHMPMPMVNVINGGAHAVNSTDIQEYMIIPAAARDIQTAIRMSSEAYHSLKEVLLQHKYGTGTGDEGGYIIQNATSNTVAFDYIRQAVMASGYRWGVDFTLGIDVAASQLFHSGRYHLAVEHRQELGARGLRDWYGDLFKQYPITAIEDPFSEESWADWQQFTNKFGENKMIVADDITATNEQRIHKAIVQKCANTLLIKPNQIGTLTETIHASKLAKMAGWQTIMSHRSGETEDAAIAHLAVGLGADYIKAGATSHGERTAKYNELLRISESLGTGSL